MFKYSFTDYKKFYKDNLILAFPIVLSQLGHTLVQVIDGVIVGHFAGTAQLAAVSLVNSLFMLILVLGLGISYGLTPLIAQANGRRDKVACGHLLFNSLIINLAISVVLYILVLVVNHFIIDHIGQEPEVVQHAKPFLGYMGISIFPLMIFQAFKQFTEGLGFTKQAMLISVWGNLINVVVGIVLVKGMFGISPMGVTGVGISTLADRVIMAVAMATYVYRSHYFKQYIPSFKKAFFNWTRVKQIVKLGAPVAMQYSFEISAFSGAGILIGTIGKVEQAAHFTALSLASFTYMLATGIANAATIKTGTNLGGKNYHDLRKSAIASYHIILVFMIITAAFFMLGNELLPYIYTSDRQVIAIAAQLLILAGIFQLFDGTQVVGLGVLRGLGDVNAPTIITFLSYWIIGMPVGYLLGFPMGMGVSGIWYGLTLGLLSSSILLFLRFQKKTKQLL
jgi:MATE family multidrug resistance protein